MMKRLATVLCLIAILACPIVTMANPDETCVPSENAVLSTGNSLVIESKTVKQGGSTTVGLAITNDVAVRNIIAPLIIREVDPGAFITALTPQRTPGGRLVNRLTGINTLNTYPREDGVQCKGGQPGGFKTMGAIDGISPDGARFNIGKLMPSEPALAPGADFAIASLQFQMTVNNTAGRFEIDTSCCDPGCHLVYVQDVTNASIVPQFTKGIITIVTCDCTYHGDVNGDGVIDLFDVLGILDYQFSSGPQPPKDASCPHVDRGDVMCDGIAYLLDAIYLIDYIYAGGPPPCDPCACVAYPTDCP